jgi:hypothetical protein
MPDELEKVASDLLYLPCLWRHLYDRAGQEAASGKRDALRHFKKGRGNSKGADRAERKAQAAVRVSVAVSSVL